MKENIESIQQSIINFVSNYEDEKSGKIDIYEKMLRSIEAPYQRMPEHDKVIGLLRSIFSEADVRAWFAFPDFDYRVDPLLPGEAAENADPEDRATFSASVQNLIDNEFLVQAPRKDGQLGYMRTYMLYLAFGSVLKNDHKPLTDAFIDWWLHVLKEDAHLRSTIPEHRVVAHEGSLTGKGNDGRISMQLDIPDTREVLPTDIAEKVIANVDRIALIDCVCRRATDARGIRKCDYPTEGVCFLFNEAATEAIQVGYGREVSNEEGIELMHHLRDMGLIQLIGNATRPLSMCNCCLCCCLCLATMARNESYIAVPSRFIVQVAHEDRCIACGKCRSACQMNAVNITEGGVEIIPSVCVGCGHCVVACPKQVLKMNLRHDAPDGLPLERLNRIYI